MKNSDVAKDSDTKKKIGYENIQIEKYSDRKIFRERNIQIENIQMENIQIEKYLDRRNSGEKYSDIKYSDTQKTPNLKIFRYLKIETENHSDIGKCGNCRFG